MTVYLGKLRQKRAGWRAKEGWFWKLSDKQTQQSVRSNVMQFLYPKSQQFPFDVVSTAIVRSLEERNWRVPGIEVEFDVYGSGEQKFRLVREIRGQDFKLYFCRVQGLIPGGRWNDIAAVTEIVIPKKELHVYDDESGPTFYLYVGKDWEQDRRKFMSSSKVNSKLCKHPKMYLKYKGACNCQSTSKASFEAIGLLTSLINRDAEKLSRLTHTHERRRSPLLVHDNDLGREYEPEPNGKWNWSMWKREPGELTMFRTADVMAEFKKYLEDVVLKQIVSHPIPTEKVDLFALSPTMPFPSSVGPLFCFAEYRDAERIRQGQENVEKLPKEDRYGLIGSGYRLAPWNVRNDGTVPEIAYEGFLWCGIGEVTPETPIESLEIPGHYRRDDCERFVIRVTANRANDIYIADHAAYEKRRKELGDAMEKGRDRFTDDEVADFIRARARTIIPISEYKGGYEQPVVLVNRELSFDEVEVVSEHEYHSRYC